MRHQLPDLPPERHGVFGTGEFGWTYSALEHAVRAGRLRRVRRGYYVDAAAWSANDDGPDAATRRLLVRTVAAVLAIPGAAASHHSAAALAQLPRWLWREERPCITVVPGGTSDTVGVHLHRASVFGGHRIDSGIPSLSVARTIIDIAREHGELDSIVVGDHALRLRMISLDELRNVAQECSAFPWIRRAWRALEQIDDRAESPLETYARLVLHRLPFPRPELQVNIFDEQGTFVARLDAYWDDWGIATEFDGRGKYQTPQDLWDEKRREDRLRELGIVIIRLAFEDLRNHALVLAKLRSAVAMAAAMPRGTRRWRITRVSRVA